MQKANLIDKGTSKSPQDCDISWPKPLNKMKRRRSSGKLLKGAKAPTTPHNKNQFLQAWGVHFLVILTLLPKSFFETIFPVVLLKGTAFPRFPMERRRSAGPPAAAGTPTSRAGTTTTMPRRPSTASRRTSTRCPPTGGGKRRTRRGRNRTFSKDMFFLME